MTENEWRTHIRKIIQDHATPPIAGPPPLAPVESNLLYTVVRLLCPRGDLCPGSETVYDDRGEPRLRACTQCVRMLDLLTIAEAVLTATVEPWESDPTEDCVRVGDDHALYAEDLLRVLQQVRCPTGTYRYNSHWQPWEPS
jgi:hypothetical protein